MLPGAVGAVAAFRELSGAKAKLAPSDDELVRALRQPAASTTASDARVSRRVGNVLARPERAADLVLAGLLGVAYIAWFIAGRRIEAPWIMGDELIYSDMAKSFAASGHYEFRDVPYQLKTIYPALVSPAWFADSIATAYAIAKGINLALMLSAAVPVYLWARRLTSAPLALVAAALVLLMPAFVYSAEVMTESAFFPAFMLATYLLARALEQPTPANQGLALAAAALAGSVRLQGLVLVAVVPVAILLKLLFDFAAERPAARLRFVRTRIRPFWPTLALIALGAGAYMVFKLSRGEPLASGLGVYQAVGEVHYSVKETARWTVFHLAELSFSVGVIPVSALIVLVGLAIRRGWTTPAERAFLAVTCAAVPLVVVQVAAFASRFSLRIEERNMFVLAPLLLLALLVWVGHGAPRPQRLATAAAVVPIGLLAVLPLESFFNVSLTSDTFGLIPLYRLSMELTGGQFDVRVLFGLGAIAAGLLFTLVPRRQALPVLSAAIAAFFILSTLAVLAMSRGQSIAALISPGGTDPAWVDRAVGPDTNVGYVNSSGLSGNPHILWQTEFWNRSVGPVLNLADSNAVVGDLATLDQSTGRIVPVHASDARDIAIDFAITERSMNVAGKLVAETGFLQLWQLQPPLRLGSQAQGIDADGWMSTSAGVTEYAAPGDRAGRIAIRLSRVGLGASAPPAHVSMTIGPFALGPAGEQLIEHVTAKRTVTLGTDRDVVVRLPTPKPPYRVELRVDPIFPAAQLGQGDTRDLGARVSFHQLRSR